MLCQRAKQSTRHPTYIFAFRNESTAPRRTRSIHRACFYVRENVVANQKQNVKAPWLATFFSCSVSVHLYIIILVGTRAVVLLDKFGLLQLHDVPSPNFHQGFTFRSGTHVSLRYPMGFYTAIFIE
ncbi:unnamed protein product [Amoebophrya sp. A120]|nr:unnamed protein product [Amoebophrya sp. A120]|eukprot:GSA120T00011865001.1